MEIFEMTRPAFGNNNMNAIWCTNKERTIETNILLKQEDMERIFAGKQKIYVEAYINSDGDLIIERYVEEQKS